MFCAVLEANFLFGSTSAFYKLLPPSCQWCQSGCNSVIPPPPQPYLSPSKFLSSSSFPCLVPSHVFTPAVKPPSKGRRKVNKQRGELDVQPRYTVQPPGPVPSSLTGSLRHPSAQTCDEFHSNSKNEGLQKILY